MLIDRADIFKPVIFTILNTINNHEISVQYYHAQQAMYHYLFIYLFITV